MSRGGPNASFIRWPDERVAELSYRIAEEEVGHVLRDGPSPRRWPADRLQLANQGPILAWG